MNTDSQNNSQNVDLQAAISPDTLQPQLSSLQRGALIAAVVGLALTVIGAITNLDHFFQAYLNSYLFWFGITVACIGFVALHNTVGGGWGFIIRRFLEAGTRLLPVMAIAFLPIAASVLMGEKSIYEWAHPSAANDPIIQKKAMYLNVPFFLARAVLYFVIWGTLAFFFNKWSRVLDEREDPKTLSKLNLLGAGTLPLHVLLVTFMSVDWAMSLTPHWFSSIYGFLFVAGQALTTLALMNLFNGTLAGKHPLISLVPQRYFRDLGNLMLAITLVWAYCSFSQYVIIYSGNVAENAIWYTVRRAGGWGIIGLMLISLHFALPFLCLLSSSLKVKPQNLAKLAAFVLFMRWIDLIWLTRPTFSETLLGGLYLSDLGTMLLLGGVWLYLWAEQVKKRPLVPLYDPRFSENWKIDHMHDHGHGHHESSHGEEQGAHQLTHHAEVKTHV